MSKTMLSGRWRMSRLALGVPIVALAVGAATVAVPTAAQAATDSHAKKSTLGVATICVTAPDPTVLASTRVVSYVRLPHHKWHVTDRAKVDANGCADVAYRRAGAVLFRAIGQEQITGANEAGTNCRVNVYRTHFGPYRGAKLGGSLTRSGALHLAVTRWYCPKQK
jgi:hypothetical protein